MLNFPARRVAVRRKSGHYDRMADTSAREEPTYLPIGLAARRLGVTTNTLRTWERQGRIAPARTPGGDRRYLTADVDALLER